MKIVADPNIPFVAEAFGALGAGQGEIALVPGREMSPANVRDADILLVRSVTPVNEALLAGSRVQFVGTATIGTDHVNERCLGVLGVGFASAAGSNANSVAEYVVAALLELAHRRKFRLRDQTLGVVGVGNVGSRVARYARALGMRVLENDPPRQQAEDLPDFVTLERVLAESDIVTVHVPLLETTRHMFHHDNLERFVLLNTARGAVVDNKALLKAIDGNRIGGAVLDVWEGEPNISPELLDVVDLGTPHIAGYSLDGKVNGVRMIYEAACRHFGIEPTWKPVLPEPPAIDLTGDLYDVVKRIYDINKDDAALRANVRDPDGIGINFDRLRAEYPVRREFAAYGFRL